MLKDRPTPKGIGGSGSTLPVRAAAWAGALGSLAIVTGTIWDLSWHTTIGRDGVFSPPHLALYAGVAALGALAGWLILHATFGNGASRSVSVRLLGLHGPVGAWISIWGVGVILIAVPLDAWWHRAYGLDVAILSLPHITFAAGFIALIGGAFLVALAAWNRDAFRGLSVTPSLLLMGGCLILAVVFATTLYATRPNNMHSRAFHFLAAVAYPALLAALARSAPLRWGATKMAAVYAALILVTGWILQLVPASPLVGPILNDVTRMVPPTLPLLLVIPAIVYDAALAERSPTGDPPAHRHEGALAVGLGLSFVVLFGVAQWLLGELLLGPARDWSGAPERWPYYDSLGDWRFEWWGRPLDVTARTAPRKFALELAAIALAAVASCRIGLFFGAWMSRLRR
jgi:hypothetical protein